MEASFSILDRVEDNMRRLSPHNTTRACKIWAVAAVRLELKSICCSIGQELKPVPDGRGCPDQRSSSIGQKIGTKHANLMPPENIASELS